MPVLLLKLLQMKEKEMADNRVSEEERRRSELIQRRQELRKKRQRQVRIIRLILVLVGIFALFLAIWGISSAIRERRNMEGSAGNQEEQILSPEVEASAENAALLAAQYDYDGAIAVLKSLENAEKDDTIQAAIAEYEGARENLTAIDAAEVRHFSFPVLLVNAEAAAEGTSPLTLEQFSQILQELYDSGYVLVDLYDLADVSEDTEGNRIYTKGVLYLPEGKKPFVLSQRDVSYPFVKAGNGYASRLIVDADGKIKNEYIQPDGSTTVGDYDVIPCLETFIEEHPDFVYRGARGTLGLTGYNGIFGYRTSSYLALSAAEGNPYADGYGTFDTAAEAQNCSVVTETLRQNGWNFASYGNSYTSYGNEFVQVQSDADQWQSNVASLIGGTDILIFPCEKDIGSRSDYTEENGKYTYLRDQGFRFYCIEDDRNASWLQVRESYVLQGIHEIDTYEDFQAAIAMQ